MVLTGHRVGVCEIAEVLSISTEQVHQIRRLCRTKSYLNIIKIVFMTDWKLFKCPSYIEVTGMSIVPHSSNNGNFDCHCCTTILVFILDSCVPSNITLIL